MFYTEKWNLYHIENMTGDVECSNETKCEINNFLNNMLTTMAFIKIWLMIIIFWDHFESCLRWYIFCKEFTHFVKCETIYDFSRKSMFRSLVIPLNRKNHLFLETNGISLNVPKSGKQCKYIYNFPSDLDSNGTWLVFKFPVESLCLST